jgi:hypothetical protein
MRAKSKQAAVLLAATTGALFATGVVAPAANAADLLLAPGSYTINTSTLKLTGPSTDRTGVAIGGVAVFKFNTINIPNGANITATGSRPLELLSANSLILGGTISASGTSATNFTGVANPGGPGGGAGGKNNTEAGHGPGGGGKPSNTDSGGGGGGFGGRGAAGGSDGGVGGARGAAYGNLNLKLQGGSGGGGSASVGGGGGGGAVALVGRSVTIQSTGEITANGGGGAVGSGASGGGSGGAITIHGGTVRIDGVLVADGGPGGAGGCCGDGGGGAGGRIAVQYKTYSSIGLLILVAEGGSSGARDSSGAGCGTPCGHGSLSPQATGDNGVITYAHIDASVLTIGKSKTITKGHAATIATRLTDRSTAAPIADQQVSLFKRACKTCAWTKVATKTTSGTGRASVLVAPSKTTRYEWRYGGGWIHDPATSPIQLITVVS